MDRREAIKATTLILGYSVSATALTGVLSGCKTDRTVTEDTWSPVFFNPDESVLITEVAETILPATETPGAKQAGAHIFIDVMLADCYSPEDQQLFHDGLAAIETECQGHYEKSFIDCTADERTVLLSGMETAQASAGDNSADRLSPGTFFGMLKELTYLGYFTSELIGEEFLNYDPIPGAYQGCLPLDEIGNSWSLS